MEVILLVDVKGLGKKDQTVKVSDGYANNYLFKKRLAVAKTAKSVEILANQQENARIQEANAIKDAQLLAAKLKDITCEFVVKVGKEGKLFGSISLKQIEEQLKDRFHIDIDKKKFIDKGPLDSLGYYRLKIELHKGVIGEINVHVKEEGK